MRRGVLLLIALSGTVSVVGGAFLGAVAGTGRTAGFAVGFVGALVGLVALAAALWKVRGQLDADSDSPVPWSADDFATPAPERTAERSSLSSDGFAWLVEDAARTARSAGTIADGVAVVRPALREALLEAMVAAGRTRNDAERALAAGSWTDDPVAASVLDATVAPPQSSLRERFGAWLFPERVLRRRVRRAGHAVAVAADAALPTIPGESAPRPVPVRKPHLEELRRDAAGELQGAVDPRAVERGPERDRDSPGLARHDTVDGEEVGGP